jgi:hypothetical protein
VKRFCRAPIDDEELSKLRYQLLTGWAGTLADAKGAAHAVFAVHEFLTDDRKDDKFAANDAELARCTDLVLEYELPAGRSRPWCVRVPDVAGVDAALYLAHVSTDLRRETLRPST